MFLNSFKNKNGKKTSKIVKKEPGVVKPNGSRKFLKKHNVERKNRIRDWFLNNHGPLPKPGLDKDVGTFLNSLPVSLISKHHGRFRTFYEICMRKSRFSQLRVLWQTSLSIT